MYIDTHCHLYKEYYDNLDEVIEKIKSNKVKYVINNGCDRKSNEEVLQLIKKYDFMYGAIGIHPEVVDEYSVEDLKFIEEHIHDKKIVAIGEIGLDYHYTLENKEEQKKLFRSQLEMARRFDIPVIIHSRDAMNDTIEILREYKVRGSIHSFSGTYEEAIELIKMGFYLGVNGTVTFKNSKLKDIYEKINLEHILLETDSPYLSPVPHRGEKNDSSNIQYIGEFLSNLKGLSTEEIGKVTSGNATKCFDI